MKRRNKITVIWTCAIVVVALFWGVALYNNARKGQSCGQRGRVANSAEGCGAGGESGV